MWFIYALLQSLFLSIVNYTDEHLTTRNRVPKSANIHTRIGGQLIISALMCFVGAGIFSLITGDYLLSRPSLLLAFVSSVFMVFTFAVYFYLLLKFPAHQVAPLFQISTVWLLIFDLLSGQALTAFGVVGLTILLYGAYMLDVGSWKWQIPGNLLRFMVLASGSWAISLFLVRLAATQSPAQAVNIWQLIGVGLIGLLLLIVTPYRQGFIYRIKHQGKSFLGLSLLNETMSETGLMFGNLSVAIAPLAAYVTALNGLQSIFLLVIFYLFPLGTRNRISRIQWLAVTLIATGTILINLK